MPIRLSFRRTHRYNVSAKDFSVIPIYTFDDSCVEYTISSSTTGKDALEFIAQRLDIDDTCFFGFKYENIYHERRWLVLNKKIKKQLEKLSKSQALYLGIMLWVDNPQYLPEEKLRRLFYYQIKKEIRDGNISLNLKLAIKLSAYMLQADFGDFVDVETTLINWRSRPAMSSLILPGAEDFSTLEHSNDIIFGYCQLKGVSSDNAIWYFLEEVRKLPDYDIQSFTGSTDDGSSAALGVSRNGLLIKIDRQNTMMNLKWQEIKDLTYSKRIFTIHTMKSNRAVHLIFNIPEDAHYLWNMCRQVHNCYIHYWTIFRSTPHKLSVFVLDPPSQTNYNKHSFEDTQELEKPDKNGQHSQSRSDNGEFSNMSKNISAMFNAFKHQEIKMNPKNITEMQESDKIVARLPSETNNNLTSPQFTLRYPEGGDTIDSQVLAAHSGKCFACLPSWVHSKFSDQRSSSANRYCPDTPRNFRENDKDLLITSSRQSLNSAKKFSLTQNSNLGLRQHRPEGCSSTSEDDDDDDTEDDDFHHFLRNSEQNNQSKLVKIKSMSLGPSGSHHWASSKKLGSYSDEEHSSENDSIKNKNNNTTVRTELSSDLKSYENKSRVSLQVPDMLILESGLSSESDFQSPVAPKFNRWIASAKKLPAMLFTGLPHSSNTNGRFSPSSSGVSTENNATSISHQDSQQKLESKKIQKMKKITNSPVISSRDSQMFTSPTYSSLQDSDIINMTHAPSKNPKIMFQKATPIGSLSSMNSSQPRMVPLSISSRSGSLNESSQGYSAECSLQTLLGTSQDSEDLMQKSDYVNSSPPTQSSVSKLNQSICHEKVMESSLLSGSSSNSCLASLVTCSSSNGAQNSEISSNETTNSDRSNNLLFENVKSPVKDTGCSNKCRSIHSETQHAKHHMSSSLINQLLNLMNLQETELAHRLLSDYHQTILSQRDDKNIVTDNQETRNNSDPSVDLMDEDILKKSLLISINNHLKSSEHLELIKANKKKDDPKMKNFNHLVDHSSGPASVSHLGNIKENGIFGHMNHSPDYVNASVFIRNEEGNSHERPISLTSSLTTTVTDNDSNATFRVLSLEETMNGSQQGIPFSSFDHHLDGRKLKSFQLRKTIGACDCSRNKSATSSGSNISKSNKNYKYSLLNQHQHCQSVCEHSLSSESEKRSTSDSGSAIDEVAAHLQHILATLPPDSATGLLSSLLREHSERRNVTVKNTRFRLSTQHEIPNDSQYNNKLLINEQPETCELDDNTNKFPFEQMDEEISTAMSSSLDGEITGILVDGEYEELAPESTVRSDLTDYFEEFCYSISSYQDNLNKTNENGMNFYVREDESVDYFDHESNKVSEETFRNRLDDYPCQNDEVYLTIHSKDIKNASENDSSYNKKNRLNSQDLVRSAKEVHSLSFDLENEQQDLYTSVYLNSDNQDLIPQSSANERIIRRVIVNDGGKKNSNLKQDVELFPSNFDHTLKAENIVSTRRFYRGSPLPLKQQPSISVSTFRRCGSMEPTISSAAKVVESRASIPPSLRISSNSETSVKPNNGNGNLFVKRIVPQPSNNTARNCIASGQTFGVTQQSTTLKKPIGMAAIVTPIRSENQRHIQGRYTQNQGFPSSLVRSSVAQIPSTRGHQAMHKKIRQPAPTISRSISMRGSQSQPFERCGNLHERRIGTQSQGNRVRPNSIGFVNVPNSQCIRNPNADNSISKPENGIKETVHREHSVLSSCSEKSTTISKHRTMVSVTERHLQCLERRTKTFNTTISALSTQNPNANTIKSECNQRIINEPKE